MGTRTEFDFLLPRGLVDADGRCHREGAMRLATAADEIAPLQDYRVKANRAYLVILLLSRVITRLGSLSGDDITPETIERLFSEDVTFLQEFYRRINDTGVPEVEGQCPACGVRFAIDVGTGHVKPGSETRIASASLGAGS
jgi:hypothetical protein